MLNAEEWTMVKSLFSAALELPREERIRWLQSQEALSDNVAREVHRLLGGEAPAEAPQEDDGRLQTRTFACEELLLGRFRIGKLLGRGGMGEVYLAWDEAFQGEVALKTVRSDRLSDPAYSARLEKEIRAARRVQHPNVCRVFDLHRDPKSDCSFLTMEFLNGPTLAELLRQGPLAKDEAIQVGEELAAGLDAIHAAGIVHRDLKPGNLFHVPRTVLADFGLAYEAGQSISESISLFGSSAIVGTPAYMAPEQLLGERAGPAADIHAFGAVMYEVFSRKKAFPGETALAAALRRLSSEELPEDPAIPGGWMRAIHSCLNRDPEKRPRSAGQAIEIASSEGSAPQWGRRSFWALGAGTSLVALGGLASWRFGRRGPAPENSEAVRHFKLGVEYARRTTNRELLASVQELETAVKLDPDFADAWAHLADSYCAAANHVALPSKVARPKAEAAARKALEINPELGLAHSSLAYVLSTDFDRWTEADQSFRKAIERSPREPVIRSRYGGYLGRRQRYEEAIAMVQSAIDLEPAQFRFQMQLAAELLRGRRFAAVLEHMNKVVEMHATNADGFLTLARALEWNGKYDAAERAILRAERLFAEADTTAYLATLRVGQGRLREATELADQYLEAWEAGNQESNTAAGVEAALGRQKNVFRIIEVALSRPDDTVLAIPSNPYLQPLSGTQELKQLRRRLKLEAG